MQQDIGKLFAREAKRIYIRKVIAREEKRIYTKVEEVEKEEQKEPERCCEKCRLGIQASWCRCGCTFMCRCDYTFSCSSLVETFIDEESSNDEEELSFEIIDESYYNKNPRYSIIPSFLELRCMYNECTFTAEDIVVDNVDKNNIWICSNCYIKRWQKKITEA